MKELSVRSVVDDGLWSASNAVLGFYLPQLEHADRVLRVCRTLSHTLTALQALPSAASGRGELAVEVDIPFLQYVAPAVRPHVERVGRALSKQHARVRALAQEDLPAKVDQLFQNLLVCLHVAAWGLSAIPAGAALYRCVAALALPFEPHAAHLLDVPDATWVELEAASERAAAAPRALPATCFSGLEDFRETLQQKVVLAARLPGLVRGARSVLLYGPRGCGKSLLALCALREAPHEKYLAHANLLASSVNARDLVRAADESARAAARRAAFVLENVDGLPPSAWNSGTHTVVFGTTANARDTNLFTSFEHRVFVDVPSAAVRRALVEQSVVAALGLSETSPQDLQYRAQLRAHPTYQRALDALVSALAPDYDRLRTELLAPAGGREPSGYETRAWLKYYLTRFAAESERAAVVQLVRYGTTDELQQAADALAARARAEEKAAHALATTLASELQALLRSLDELSENLAGVRPVPAGGAALSSAALSLSALSRTKFVAFLERSLREYTLPTLLVVTGVSGAMGATAMAVPWAALGSAAYTSGAAALGSAATLANSTLAPVASAALGSATTLASSTLVPVASGVAAALGDVASAAALGMAAAALLPGPAAFASQLLGTQGAALAPRLAADFRKRTNLDPLHALAAELDVERARVREALRRAQLYPGDEAVELAAVRAADSLHALLQRYAAAAERAHSSFGEYALALRARADECAKVYSTLDFTADARTTTPEDVEQEFNAFPVVPLERAGAYSAAAAARAPYVAAQHANAVSAKDLADATRTVTWFNRFWLDFGGVRSNAEVLAAKVGYARSSMFDVPIGKFEINPRLMEYASTPDELKNNPDIKEDARNKHAKLLTQLTKATEVQKQSLDAFTDIRKTYLEQKKTANRLAIESKNQQLEAQLTIDRATVTAKPTGLWRLIYWNTSEATKPSTTEPESKDTKNLRAELTELQNYDPLVEEYKLLDQINDEKTSTTNDELLEEYITKYRKLKSDMINVSTLKAELADVVELNGGRRSQHVQFVGSKSERPKKETGNDIFKINTTFKNALQIVTGNPFRFTTSSDAVEKFFRDVQLVWGERCPTSTVVLAWFVQLHRRNETKVEGLWVNKWEVRYRPAENEPVATVHVAALFFRYLLVAYLTAVNLSTFDVATHDDNFFKTLDLGKEVGAQRAATARSEFANLFEKNLLEKTWICYMDPFKTATSSDMFKDQKYFQFFRSISYDSTRKLGVGWAPEGAAYCSQGKEAEETRRGAWRLNGHSSTVLDAKLLAHSGTDWSKYFLTDERSPGVILENYLKYNVQEALRALPCIPGQEGAAKKLVNEVKNAVDKVSDDDFGPFVMVNGARAPDLDEERERTFDSLVAPEVNATSFDEKRTRQLCNAFFTFQDAATPVWWHAELDAAALFALVLRAEPHPMAFTRVDERAAWGVQHLAYAVLFYRIEEVLRVMLPFGYTLRDAYRAAYRSFSTNKIDHEHVFFAWALEHFRNEFRTLRSWLEQAVPDAVRAAAKPDDNKPTGKSGEKSGGKLDDKSGGKLTDKSGTMPTGKFDTAKFRSVFREKTGFDLQLDDEYVQLLEDGRAPNEGPPYAAVEYGVESSAEENLAAFEKALAVANPSSASKTQQPLLHKVRWPRETVAAHALLAKFTRAPVPSAALAELSSQLQACSAFHFKQVVRVTVPELVRGDAEKAETLPNVEDSEGDEGDGIQSESDDTKNDESNTMRGKMMSSNTFSSTDNKKQYVRVWRNGKSTVHPLKSDVVDLGETISPAAVKETEPKVNGWVRIALLDDSNKITRRGWYDTSKSDSKPFFPKNQTSTLESTRSRFQLDTGEQYKVVLRVNATTPQLCDGDGKLITAKSSKSYTEAKQRYFQLDNKPSYKLVFDEYSQSDIWYDEYPKSEIGYNITPSARIVADDKEIQELEVAAKKKIYHTVVDDTAGTLKLTVHSNSFAVDEWKEETIEEVNSSVKLKAYLTEQILYKKFIPVHRIEKDGKREPGWYDNDAKTLILRTGIEQQQPGTQEIDKIEYHRKMLNNPSKGTEISMTSVDVAADKKETESFEANEIKSGTGYVTVFDPHTKLYVAYNLKDDQPDFNYTGEIKNVVSSESRRNTNQNQNIFPSQTNRLFTETNGANEELFNQLLQLYRSGKSPDDVGLIMEEAHRKGVINAGNFNESLTKSIKNYLSDMGSGLVAARSTIWERAEKVYDVRTLLKFSELVHAALDARLLYVAAKNLSDTFVDALKVARTTLKTPSAAAALLQPAQLRSNFKEAAKQQPGWDALAVAPRRGLRARSAEQPRELSPQEADQKVEQAFRALRELQHARRLAPYGYSARDIADATRQGVEDFVYSTLDAVPADAAAECAPFCSETSVDAKGERVKRCKAKECSNAVFGVFEVAQRVEHVKEFVCGPLYGGSARDRTCGMPVAELSSLFAAFLKMYKENPQPYTKSALESLTRQLETELNRADALTSNNRRAAAHTLVPTVTRAATLQSTQPVALYELFRHICVVLESKRSSVTRDEYLPLLLRHLMTDL